MNLSIQDLKKLDMDYKNEKYYTNIEFLPHCDSFHTPVNPSKPMPRRNICIAEYVPDSLATLFLNIMAWKYGIPKGLGQKDYTKKYYPNPKVIKDDWEHFKMYMNDLDGMCQTIQIPENCKNSKYLK